MGLRPLLDGRRKNTRDRFWTRVAIGDTDDCWEWTGPLDDGYGRVGINGRPIPAHRVAYELAIGAIPKDHHLHHICQNSACVNPRHLQPLLQDSHAELHAGSKIGFCATCGGPKERKHGRWCCLACDRARKASERSVLSDAERAEIRRRDRERKLRQRQHRADRH